MDEWDCKRAAPPEKNGRASVSAEAGNGVSLSTKWADFARLLRGCASFRAILLQLSPLPGAVVV